MEEDVRKSYRCVHCNGEVGSLFEKMDEHYIKVEKCRRCGEAADPYIECEGAVALLDAALLRVAACRHLLHNHAFSQGAAPVVRLVIGCVLSEAYHLCLTMGGPSEPLLYAMAAVAALGVLVNCVIVEALRAWLGRPGCSSPGHTTSPSTPLATLRCAALHTSVHLLLLPVAVWRASLCRPLIYALALYRVAMATAVLQAECGDRKRASMATVVAGGTVGVVCVGGEWVAPHLAPLLVPLLAS